MTLTSQLLPVSEALTFPLWNADPVGVGPIPQVAVLKLRARMHSTLPRIF